MTGNTELSVSGIPALFAAVLFGPLAAGLVGAASMLGDPELTSRDRRAPRLKWASYTSTRFIVGALTGLAAQATHRIRTVGASAVWSQRRLSRRSSANSSTSGLRRSRRGARRFRERLHDSLGPRTPCGTADLRTARGAARHSCTSTSRRGRSRSSSRRRLLRKGCTRYNRSSADSPPTSRSPTKLLERANLQFAAH